MKYFSLFLLIIIPRIVYSQNFDSIFNSKPKNAIYAELGGNSIIYGINYERSLLNFASFTLASSIGYGFSSSKFGNFNNPVIPFELKIFNGISKKNHMEFGLGITYYYNNYTPDIYINGVKVPYNRHKFLGFSRIGYRYTGKNGFLFRLGFTPFYVPNGEPLVYPFGSFSLGYIF